jgi:hypothetical protein
MAAGIPWQEWWKGLVHLMATKKQREKEKGVRVLISF